ncbi:MAG TPA: protein kinase, partial [Polyangiaceae bacterium]|nr:protein kinase [Polyangiaceae bacterium]
MERVRPLRMVGRCELFEEIDSGGMATVHLGRQTAIGGFAKIVAIKRMHHQFAKDPQFVAMFLDEARLVARIKHPNVLPTLDLIEERGELFIVMEYLPGVTLGQLQIAVYKRQERIPVPIALRIVCGMLHGLHAAHGAKGPSGEPMQLVHRDVSPENIFVGTDGVARLLDFGMARALDRLHITQAGQVKGKLSVMAPEQVQGKIVTQKTDVFASGVVLWQALTGQRLIQGEHMAEIAHNVVHQVFEPPTHRVPNLPKKLDAIVMRALERDPEKRWPNAEKMAIALEAVCDLATQREVGVWVQKVAWERLAVRAKMVAAIESTPVEAEADKRIPAAEDSGTAMSTSARHSLDRLGQVASALLKTSRETFAGLLQRNADGKIDFAATMKQPRVAAIAALGTLVVLLLVGLIAASGEEVGAATASGVTPPKIVPRGTSSSPASSAQPKALDPRVAIPAGEFLHGCNTWADTACALDEMPGRKLKVAAFEIDRTEVTAREYRACVDAGACNDEHV